LNLRTDDFQSHRYPIRPQGASPQASAEDQSALRIVDTNGEIGCRMFSGIRSATEERGKIRFASLIRCWEELK
jgi:hypothetical protein